MNVLSFLKFYCHQLLQALQLWRIWNLSFLEPMAKDILRREFQKAIQVNKK